MMEPNDAAADVSSEESETDSTLEEASAAFVTEMTASGYGRNYAARGDINFIYYDSEVIRTIRVYPAELAQAHEYFVQPDRYSIALDTLWREHVVVLCSATGTGRRTTALAIYHDLNKRRHEDTPELEQIACRELVPEWKRPHVEILRHSPGHGYILDLSRSEDADPPELDFAQDLIAIHASKLQLDDAYLVIIASPLEWTNCALEADGLTVPLTPPKPADIIEKRLNEQFSAAERMRHVRTGAFKEITEGSLPPESAVELAEAIGNSEDTPEAMQQVLDQFQGWNRYLKNWFDENKSEGDRARLIAAALLGEAPDKYIIEAADALLKTLNRRHDVEGALSGPDLSELLTPLKARRTGDILSITYDKPHLDSAVLDHIWRERPKLRSFFGKWVVEISESASPRLLSRIASQLVGLAVRQAPDTYLELVEAWSIGKPVRQRLAHDMLAQTVLHPKVGGRVRKRMGEWARNSGTSKQLREIVANVCGEVLAVEKPDVALTRLRDILTRQLERHHDLGGSLEALRQIAQLPGMAYPTLDRVLYWLKDGKTGAAGAHAFLALVGEARPDVGSVVPKLLTEDAPERDVRRQLRQGWVAVSALPEYREETKQSMVFWLNAADGLLLDAQTVISILAPALRESLDRSLVGEIAAECRVTPPRDIFTVPAWRQLLEALLWRNGAADPATAWPATNSDSGRPQT